MNVSGKPLVSILLVTHNAEAYVHQTLQSCLKQTLRNTELLIFDNASADRTLNIVHQVRDSRIRVVSSAQNIGPYQALNKLLEMARGLFIAIQDHDDLWCQSKLERQIADLQHHPEVIGCGTWTFYWYVKKNIFILDPIPLIVPFVDHTSLLFRNQGQRYPTDRILADEFFIRQILRGKGALRCIQAPLTIHRIRADRSNLSSQRAKLSVKLLREYYALHGVIGTLTAFGFLIAAYLPEQLLWSLRRWITMKHAHWYTGAEFRRLFPEQHDALG